MKKFEVSKAVQEKWDKLGFLDGLKGHVKEDIAKLYECCKKTILTEKSVEKESESKN